MATQTTHLGLTNQAGTDKNHRPVINGNNDIVDNWATGVDTHLANIDANMAFVAVQSGNNWQLPSGKSAAIGEYIVVDGILGHATAAITGGSTNIVSGTNWTPETKGGLNALNDNLNPKRGDLNTISSDTTIMALDAGTYQVVLSSGTPVTNGYIPAQYGTLIVNDSGKNYKSYTFVSTGNAVYSRICHKGNSTWYTAWQELVVNINTINSVGVGIEYNVEYTAPTDGYIRAIGPTSGIITVTVNGLYIVQASNGGYASLFIRKGMKLKQVTNNGGSAIFFKIE
ncbi:MAG: hypothetical protein IKQ01_06570 [Bacteroidales bacterium]|nr:hypothetical protein [Bacteroidales bacterium]